MGCIHSNSNYPLESSPPQPTGTTKNHANAAMYNALPSEYEIHRVVKVYDGDTITLQDKRRVRFLGIDTPELAERQPFAKEAKQYTEETCLGKDVFISFEPGSDKTDRYGRILAWIWVGQNVGYLNLNEALVSQGYASVYTPGKKKLQNYEKLIKLQSQAKQNKLGKWKEFKDFNVFKTRNGKAFHVRNCKHLAKSKKLDRLKASIAMNQGLHACRTCLPDV